MKINKKIKLLLGLGIGIAGIGITTPLIVSCSSNPTNPTPSPTTPTPSTPNEPSSEDLYRQTGSTCLFDTIIGSIGLIDNLKYIKNNYFENQHFEINKDNTCNWGHDAYPPGTILFTRNNWKNITQGGFGGFPYVCIKFNGITILDDSVPTTSPTTPAAIINDIYSIDYVDMGQQKQIMFDKNNPNECPDINIFIPSQDHYFESTINIYKYLAKNAKPIVNPWLVDKIINCDGIR